MFTLCPPAPAGWILPVIKRDFHFPAGLFVFGLCCSAVSLPAQINSWTNPRSAGWESASWSLGVLPGTNQTILITNADWKAVGITPATAQDFAQTLSIASLTISSPTNSFNTLLLNFAGPDRPLVIGVDSNSPGTLTIDSSSAVEMFSSGLIVNNALGTNSSRLGTFEVDGTFSENESSKVTAGFLDVGGSYNLTNSVVSSGSEFINGTFNQQGGTNVGTVDMKSGGRYNLFDGVVQGSVALNDDIAGVFYQWGGTNFGGLGLGGAGVYQLSGGLLVPGDLEVGPPSLSPLSFGAGVLVQTGGTNNAGRITMGVGSYSLDGGVLTASSLELPTVSDRHGSYGSLFDQSGGYFTSGFIGMSGTYDTRFGFQPATYNLSGGELDTPAITMTMGLVKQTGGINRVGNLTLDWISSYVMKGGLLVVTNLTQNGETAFSLVGSIQQSGGTNEVLGTLFVGGNSSYDFTNGLLVADDIQLTGQAVFLHVGGSFAGLDNILLAGGSWAERTSGDQLGQLGLGAGTSSNSFLDLPPGPCVLSFANSSGVAWSNTATLTIEGWNGSVSGGGIHQIYFGNHSNGLNNSQLAQVWFQNPAGMSGNYPAAILPTGEIVPSGSLVMKRAGGDLEFNWSGHFTLQTSTNVAGPYEDITTVTNFYTHPPVDPRRFFRLAP